MDPRIVSSLVFIVLVLARQVQGIKSVTVNAGMTYPDGSLLLIAGEDLMLLQNNEEVDIGKTANMELPDDFETVKALKAPDVGELYAFYAPTIYYVYDADEGIFQRFEYSERLQEFLGNDGPDAVARRNGMTFFFKGCKVAVPTDNDMENIKKRKINKFGLPCSPDAAWTSPDESKIIVLKGDQIWIWGGGRDVDGPKAFSSMYTITSWELIPDGGEK